MSWEYTVIAWKTRQHIVLVCAGYVASTTPEVMLLSFKLELKTLTTEVIYMDCSVHGIML